MKIQVAPLRFAKRCKRSFSSCRAPKRCGRSFLAIFFCSASLLFAQHAAPGPAPQVSPADPNQQSQKSSLADSNGSDHSPSGSDIVNSLSSSELKEAIDDLKAHYFRPAELADGELQRAMLAGILARISPGASILSSERVVDQASSPFKKEILKDSIAYLHMGSLTKENLAELEAALKSIQGGPVGSVILDLRATPESNDFQTAAEVLQLFCPGGKPALFSIKKTSPGADRVFVSKQDPAFKGPLMVLVGRENTGASEIVAAVLRLQAGAILIGERTKGEGVEFADFKLGPKKTIRIAISEIAMPNGSAIYPEGVKPDLPVEMAPELARKVLFKELEQGVAALVFETERPRVNEASLVAGTNPEMDAYQSAQQSGAGKGARPEPPLRDAALQRAVDLIATIAIYERERK